MACMSPKKLHGLNEIESKKHMTKSKRRESDAYPKILSFLLPQFHDDPYNDEWWGKGFNEWVNVKAAKPLFKDHDQPRIPRDGYYKYETSCELGQQFDQAYAHGIDGFVFYHYWSKGVRLLKKPLDMLLADKELAKKSNFALCWANHSWTRSWKNRQGALDVLLEQEYETDETEIMEHVNFFIRCFQDDRYLKLNGEPVLFIYRPEAIPNLDDFVALLNAQAQKVLGASCHVSGMITTWQPEWTYLDKLSSATLAQPASALYSPAKIFSPLAKAKSVWFKPSNFVRALPDSVKKLLYPIQDRFFDRITFFDYEQTWSKLLEQMRYCLDQKRIVHFSTFVDFDNTARYGSRARLFRGFSPKSFEDNLTKAVQIARKNRRSGLLLINAWNEWAEGMYLQADQRYGNARLEAVARARAIAADKKRG